MELDLEQQTDVMSERSESTLTKPPSPTTEKVPFVPIAKPTPPHQESGSGDNYNSQQEVVNGNGATESPMEERHNTAEQSVMQEQQNAVEQSRMDTNGFHPREEDSDSDMPPLEFEAGRGAAVVADKNERNREEEEGAGDATVPDEPTVGDDEWMDILGNGLLKKKVVVAGQGIDTRPLRGERVVVDVRAELDDGTEVQNDEDCEATMAEGDLITAVDMCLSLMEKGETCELKSHPKYAYGKLGCEPNIPADSHMNYTLTLKDVQPPLESDALTIEQRIKHGTAKRERGNFYFARNEHPQAVSCYNKAIEILRRPERSESSGQVDSEKLQELLDVEAKCSNNLAAAQLKMEAYDAAIISCDGVLRLQPQNVKALFRKGKALAGKGELEAGIAMLRQALEIEPESKLIHAELSRLVAKQKGEANRERDVYKRMFAQKEDPSDNNNTSSTMPWMGLVALILAVIMGLYLYYNRQD